MMRLSTLPRTNWYLILLGFPCLKWGGTQFNRNFFILNLGGLMIHDFSEWKNIDQCTMYIPVGHGLFQSIFCKQEHASRLGTAENQ